MKDIYRDAIQEKLDWVLDAYDECPVCEQPFDGAAVVAGSLGPVESVCLWHGIVICHDLPFERPASVVEVQYTGRGPSARLFDIKTEDSGP